MATRTPQSEKADIVEAELGNGINTQINKIDFMATAPGTTLDSFSHIDEKKVLRKVSLSTQS